MPSPDDALYDLLLTLVTAEQLRRLVGRQFGPEVAAELPFTGSTADLTAATVEVLRRRGHIAPPLFEALAHAAPARRAEIAAVARACGCTPPPAPSATRARAARPLRLLWWALPVAAGAVIIQVGGLRECGSGARPPAVADASLTPSPEVKPPPVATTIPPPAPAGCGPVPAGMVCVPGGLFRGGSTEREMTEAFNWCKAHRDTASCTMRYFQRETPREEELTSFILDAHEVTTGAFAAWLGRQRDLTIRWEEGPVRRGEVWMGAERIAMVTDAAASDAAIASGTATGAVGHLLAQGGQFSARPGFAARPVVYVSWYAANRYCYDHDGRLPAENEWEYAARGAARRRFPWGDRRPGAGDCPGVVIARAPDDVCPDGPFMPEPAARRELDRTPDNVLDLAGNVSEWVATPYIDPASCTPERGAPCCKAEEPAQRRAATGIWTDCRVVRGGNWESDAEAARAAGRSRRRAGEIARVIGFRCAR